MKIGYVCTNYNNSSFTQEAVRSFLNNGAHEYRVVIVDNHSDPENVRLLETLPREFESVELILNRENKGYFRGLNDGIRHLRRHHPEFQHLAVGNNDLVFPADFADSVDRCEQVFSRYAVVSPDIVTLDGVHQNPHVIKKIGRSRELIYDLYYLNYYLAMALRRLSKWTQRFTSRSDTTQHRIAQEINQGHGACYLLGPEFFRHFEELWAPSFLMHEEFFLNKQLADKGLCIYYEPSIKVSHHWHAAIDKVPAKGIWRAAKDTHKIVREIRSQRGPYLRARGYQLCTNCVMDTTDPGITFDDKGVCDHCNTFEEWTRPNWHPNEAGREALQKKIDEIKKTGTGKDFDCIIGMSGGVDSSYLTYIAKQQLGLRPLVFHVDGGWNSQIAVNNIEKLVDKLGLELYTEVIDWNEMRDLQLAFFKSGVPHIDLPQDHAFFATMYKFAEKHGVKYILTGGNVSTECVRNPLDFFYYGTDLWQIRDIHRKFGKVSLVNFPLSGILRHKVYLRYFKRIQVVKPLDCISYVKKDAEKLLIEQFGCQIYPQKHFESRFTKFYEGYWLPRKFGFDTRRVHFSSLILTGQMTRGVALTELSGSSFDERSIAQDFEYVATKLGITVAELQGYMDAPNKSFRDYRNQLRLFQMGARVMQLMGLERAIKR